MLKQISISSFKSLLNIDRLDLPRLAVLFGPNAAGKSNFLDAIQALSRIGTARTLAEALQEPIRGYPIEAFSFPEGGLPDLLSQREARFALQAILKCDRDSFEYRTAVRIDPRSGGLAIEDEYLAALTANLTTKGNPLIERRDGDLRIRRKSKPAHPRQEPIGLNHTLLSDPRLGGLEYRGIERCRNELLGWRTYYLDPRVSMRRATAPADVTDIGVLGEDVAPFLFRLRADYDKEYRAIVRTLRTLIPSIEDVTVDLDKRRGTLDIVVRQNGVEYSSRIISEGTLRVLALCAIAVNPWSGSLLAFEEPENGVHPHRLELIAELLATLALERDRQVLVTTHSPLFCGTIFRRQRAQPDDIGLFQVSQGAGGSEVKRFEDPGPLFTDSEVLKALSAPTEDRILQDLLVRGILDA